MSCVIVLQLFSFFQGACDLRMQNTSGSSQTRLLQVRYALFTILYNLRQRLLTLVSNFSVNEELWSRSCNEDVPKGSVI